MLLIIIKIFCILIHIRKMYKIIIIDLSYYKKFQFQHEFSYLSSQVTNQFFLPLLFQVNLFHMQCDISEKENSTTILKLCFF